KQPTVSSKAPFQFEQELIRLYNGASGKDPFSKGLHEYTLLARAVSIPGRPSGNVMYIPALEENEATIIANHYHAHAIWRHVLPTERTIPEKDYVHKVLSQDDLSHTTPY